MILDSDRRAAWMLGGAIGFVIRNLHREHALHRHAAGGAGTRLGERSANPARRPCVLLGLSLLVRVPLAFTSLSFRLGRYPDPVADAFSLGMSSC